MTSPAPAEDGDGRPAAPVGGAPPATQPPVDGAPDRADPRELRDPKDMRALAHPTRLAILEMLVLHGELTATQAAALVGESPSSCSFHLRTLAKHNFVEETGGGHGRQRPWRLVNVGTSIGSFDDPETTIAADVLTEMYIERPLARMRQWRQRRRELPKEWKQASTFTETMAWVTPEEVREINRAVYAVMDKHRDRLLDNSIRPDGSKPVELLYFAYPVEEWEKRPDNDDADS
jgi:DNA-binding transcriptional ArsR family regulator